MRARRRRCAAAAGTPSGCKALFAPRLLARCRRCAVAVGTTSDCTASFKFEIKKIELRFSPKVKFNFTFFLKKLQKRPKTQFNFLFLND
ncbi:MAG: hypothetical protein SPI19_03435 [Peptoniphilaceae bacterium]|nr:hypothetical protein [Peptoniphilaceae bacterium]